MERTERLERTFGMKSFSLREFKLNRKPRSVRSIRSTGVKNAGKTSILNSAFVD